MHNKPHSEETKEKCRVANLGKHFSPLTEFKKGRKYSDEERKKFSEIHKRLGTRPPSALGKKFPGRILSEQHKLAISRANSGKGHPGLKGSENPRWIADRTKVVGRHNRSFHDPETKQWRMQVYLRDGFKCRIADENCVGRIEAHHILGWKKYPELRYKTNNGITLCHFHHPRKRVDERRLAPMLQKLVRSY